MDAYLAIASRRDRREYDGRPLAEVTTTRILDAGRLSGSAGNRQRWRFVVVESAEARERLAAAVYTRTNVERAGLVVGIVVPEGRLPTFDAGRAAQQMLLAGWNERVLGCPNGLRDEAAGRDVLRVADGETVAIVLSFGYPARLPNVDRRSAEEWSAAANRRPLDDLVERV